MKILVTSDWQAQWSNLDLCRRAHHRELELMDKLECKAHIDLGDSKEQYNPVDERVIEFMFQRTENILKQVHPSHCIRLMGNHDRIGQYADDQHWLKLFEHFGIVIADKPMMARFDRGSDSINFACLPYIHNPQKRIKWAKQLAEQAEHNPLPTVLLFHNDIKGVSYNNLSTDRSEAELTPKHIQPQRYRICLGGHIHKRQQFAGNMWYVGNPFVFDQGEVNQHKGFGVWDSETNELGFHSSRLPELFTYSYLKETGEKPVPGTKIKEVLDCEIGSDYQNALADRAAKIEQRFPNCVAYVVPRFSNTKIKTKVEVDPQSTDAQKIQMYVKATLPKELKQSQSAVLSYMQHVMEEVSGNSLRSQGKMRFTDVRAQNVLSFHEATFSLRNRGLVLVKGENRDWPGRSIGAGKTSLLSLVAIAMFGKTFKDQKNDGWANSFTKDPARVVLGLEDSRGRKIKVIRGRRPMRLKMLINGVDESSGMRHRGKKETQGQIEELTGYTFETLSNSIYIDQSVANAFLTGTDKTRSELINKFQGLDRFKLGRDYVAKNIATLKATMSILEDEIHTQHVIAEQHEAAKKEHLEALKTNRREAIRKRNEAIEAYNKVQAETKPQINALETTLAKHEKEYNEVYKRYVQESRDTHVLSDEIWTRKEKLKTYKQLAFSKVCSQCGQKVTQESRQKLLQKMQKTIDELAAKFRDASSEEARLKEICNKIIAKKVAKQAELDVLTNEVEAARWAFEKVKAVTEDHLQNRTNEDRKIHAIDQAITKCHTTVANFKATFREHQNTMQFLQYAQMAFSREGLPSFLNKLVCPLLNASAGYYSELFVDKEIQVLFDVVDDAIVPRVANTHGGMHLGDQSSGEKAWAGLITSFALREVAHPSNLLILDEPGHSLDQESAKVFGNKLSRLTEKFETILLTTHNPAIEQGLSNATIITVVKKNRTSMLK